MQLNIAFIGCDNRHTHQCLRQLVRDNIEQVVFFNELRGRVWLVDGTVIEAIRSNHQLDGKRYDQVIVATSRFKDVFIEREGDIEWLWHTTACSIIDEAFRFQYYDSDAKEVDS